MNCLPPQMLESSTLGTFDYLIRHLEFRLEDLLSGLRWIHISLVILEVTKSPSGARRVWIEKFKGLYLWFEMKCMWERL